MNDHRVSDGSEPKGTSEYRVRGAKRPQHDHRVCAPVLPYASRVGSSDGSLSVALQWDRREAAAEGSGKEIEQLRKRGEGSDGGR